MELESLVEVGNCRTSSPADYAALLIAFAWLENIGADLSARFPFQTGNQVQSFSDIQREC